MEANLEGANLAGADLRDAALGTRMLLNEIRVRGATYDATTRWPEGLHPRRLGCVALQLPTEVVPSAEGGAGNEVVPRPAAPDRQGGSGS